MVRLLTAFRRHWNLLPRQIRFIKEHGSEEELANLDCWKYSAFSSQSSPLDRAAIENG
jgi:hypothetical protein